VSFPFPKPPASPGRRSLPPNLVALGPENAVWIDPCENDGAGGGPTPWNVLAGIAVADPGDLQEIEIFQARPYIENGARLP